MVDEPMSGTLAIAVTLWRSAVQQRSSSWSRPNGPCSPIDEDEIEVELPQNVDHPWGWEREVVAVRFASGTHGGFDSVGLLHPMSSYVRRLRSDRPNPVGVWPVGSGRTPYQEKPVSKMSCKAPSGQRPLCTESAHTRDWFAGSKWTRADIPSNCAAASVVD